MSHLHPARPTQEWTLLIFEALQKAVEIIVRARLSSADLPPQSSSTSTASSSSRRSRVGHFIKHDESDLLEGSTIRHDCFSYVLYHAHVSIFRAVVAMMILNHVCPHVTK